MNGLLEMADFTFTTKYARYDENKKRRETWNETVSRVEKMHLKRFSYLPAEDKAEIKEAFDLVREKEVVPSMRSMQFGGKAIEAHHMRIYNCLDKDTAFITSNGVKSFNDYKDGDSVTVLTHKGRWKKAIVRNYGNDYLYPITIKRSKNSQTVWATKNHRWLLKDESVTDSLEVGQILRGAADIFSEFSYENATQEEKLYWAYGYVYGDGTLVSSGDNKYSMVRLCKKDANYNKRFEELGFKTSTSLSCDGDFMAYTGRYLKTAPNPSVDSPNLIKAFVAGYCDADAYKRHINKEVPENKYYDIQSSDPEHIAFIRACFPIAGIYLVSEKDITGEVTNYGTRPFTIKFRLVNSLNNKINSNTPFIVSEIGEPRFDQVWCLEVEEDQSFTLPNGLVTGNCAVTHIHSIRSFAESFYSLLCGNGIGFGLTERFLNRLPDLVNAKDKTGTVITYTVQDNIEGWADSVEALLNCYFKNTAYTGRKIVFDYSKIRPRGAKLKTGGGKAPGYKGLKNCHGKIKALLDRIIEEKGQKRLRPIDAYDILMHTADAVLSGGIRRSACSVIFDANDTEMMNAKTGNWFTENPQRARSNNSAIIIRGKTSFEDFKILINKTKEFGEPGFLYVVDDRQLLNPCFTADTKVLTESGWKSFESLLGTDTTIIQDSRVKGTLTDGSEQWYVNMKNAGAVKNLASNIRLTAKNQEVFLLTTKCGRQVKATGNHSFATPNGMVELKDLKENDIILVGVNNLYIPDKQSNQYKEGFTAGLVYGDGNITESSVNIDVWIDKSKQDDINELQLILQEISKQELDNQQTHKKLPTFHECFTTEKFTKYRLTSAAIWRVLTKKGFTKNHIKWIHSLDKNFKSGFLAGLFYSDGHVDFNNKSRSISLRITSNNFEGLQDVQLVCQELGIFSNIKTLLPAKKTLLPDGKGGEKWYDCKPTFRLIVGGKQNCHNFSSVIDFVKSYKMTKFRALLSTINDPNHTQTFQSKVQSVKFIGIEDVYCLSEDQNRTLIAEGLTARRCFEISFIPVTEDGRCGFQMCNLSSINGAKINTLAKYKRAAWAASLIGTLQASYTDFPYLGHTSEELTKAEALLGVSITGLMDNPDILLNADNQKECAKIAVETNKIWAKKIGIKQAARVTCVKPEGTSSIVLGSSSGIHPHHARKYFRRIQVNKDDNVYNFFKLYNPHAVEPSVWSANKTDDVITFPIEVSPNAIVKEELSALQHLEIIKSTQLNWVNTGTTEANTKPLDHSVSCTVMVKDHEWEEVTKYLFDNQKYFTAVSLLPATGDKIYQQAPMEAVVSPEDEAKWTDLVAKWESVDFSKLEETDDETSHLAEAACAGGKCETTKL